MSKIAQSMDLRSGIGKTLNTHLQDYDVIKLANTKREEELNTSCPSSSTILALFFLTKTIQGKPATSSLLSICCK